jgi:hypothetical protein
MAYVAAITSNMLTHLCKLHPSIPTTGEKKNQQHNFVFPLQSSSSSQLILTWPKKLQGRLGMFIVVNMRPFLVVEKNRGF